MEVQETEVQAGANRHGSGILHQDQLRLSRPSGIVLGDGAPA
jgi:hypothetical protein